MTEPREIKPEDVRTGDRIRVTDAWEGTARVWGGGTGYTVRQDDDALTYMADVKAGRTITLLDRPLPPIPEDVGTLIRGRHDEWVYERVRGGWLKLHTASFDAHYLPDVPTREHYDVLWPKE